MPTSTEIRRYIVACDQRFIGFTADGAYRLETEDGEVVMDPEAYERAHPTDPEERTYALLHLALREVRSCETLPAGEVVDLLLDIRGAVQTAFEVHAGRQRLLYEAWTAAIENRGP